MNEQHYVLAVAFDPDLRRAPLVTKARPEHLAGLLNAPGGKVEGEESTYEAAAREFAEEVGVAVPVARWQSVGGLSARRPDGRLYVISVLVAVLTAEEAAQVRTTTDEPVRWHDVHADLGALLSVGAPRLACWLAAALDRVRIRGARPVTVAIAEI